MICDFPDLLRLFAAHTATDISGVPEYTALCQKYENNGPFQIQRAILERVRQTLDQILEPQPAYKGQNRRAVILLEQVRGSAEFEWYYELIVAVYKPRWPEALFEHFERAARSLRVMVCDFPELVRLFAANPVKNIGNIAEYRELCEKHGDNRQFQEQRHTVERIKTVLEQLLEGQPNYTRQIRESLIKLQKNRGGPDFEWYYDMIVAAYKHGWSEAQQEYFDRVVRTIRSGNEFFLSFTSRPQDLKADKPVNRRYWYFIRGVMRADNITHDDRRNRNLLAETVYTLLREGSFHGFYHKVHEGDNRRVLADLIEGCATSRVFIQLVQNIMFEVPPDGRPNYCEFEYRKACESIIDEDPDSEDRLIFVIAEEENAFIEPDRVPDAYSDWYGHITQKDRPSLPKVDTFDQAKLSQIRETFDKIILPQVRSAWKNALDRIP